MKGDIHRYPMGAKDITEKTLESYSDVFADIINVLMFQGRRVIQAEELEERAPRSVYKTDGKIHETERDVVKRWKKDERYIACIGLENQTSSDPDMPLRIIQYDGAEYRAQLLKGGQKKRYPVVTLVLYFGFERPWPYAPELRERLQIPDELESYVSDYQINIFEIAYLTDEQLDMFESDFRVIADYFVQMRKTGEYHPEAREILHVRETLHMLSVLAGDSRFEDVNNAEQKGVRTMCEVLDRIEQRGLIQGRKEGREEGREEGRKEGIEKGIEKGIQQMIFRMYKNGYSIKQIATVAEMSEKSVEKIVG